MDFVPVVFSAKSPHTSPVSRLSACLSAVLALAIISLSAWGADRYFNAPALPVTATITGWDFERDSVFYCGRRHDSPTWWLLFSCRDPHTGQIVNGQVPVGLQDYHRAFKGAKIHVVAHYRPLTGRLGYFAWK
jgi:hypothetical protein